MFEKRVAPSSDWIPLRAAPLRIQAVSDQDGGSRLLERIEIEDYIRSQLVVGPVRRCEVDFDQGSVEIQWRPSSDEDDRSYYGDELYLVLIAGWSPEDSDYDGLAEFESRAQEIWPQMEDRFRAALWSRRWAIVGRVNSPYVGAFTEIELREFLSFRIVDWLRGVAEDEFGQRIYSIHLVEQHPELDAVHSDWCSYPKSAKVARVLYLAWVDRESGLDQSAVHEAKAALGGGAITFTLRDALRKACEKNASNSALARETVDRAIDLVQRLRLCQPSRADLKRFGIE